jgi:ADP-heptose:LPS heptosyltransferase
VRENISDYPGRILVIRYSGLGDFILSIPFLSNLRQSFPDAHIELASHSSHFNLIRGMNLIDKYISEEKLGLYYLYSESPEIVIDHGFDPSNYDLILPFTKHNSIMVRNLLKMTRRVHPIEPIPPSDSNVHVIDFLLAQVPEGIRNYSSIPRISLKDEDLELGNAFISKNYPIITKEKDIIAIHPGSGSPKKNWPVESFVKLIYQLIKDKMGVPFLIEGPADGEIIFRIKELMGMEIPEVVKFMDLVNLSSFLNSVSIYIGNDSGVTHLASALGCKIVALFGPSHPGVWAPKGDFVKVLWKGLSCSPCHLKDNTSCNKNRCMELIGWEEVMEAIRNICKITL